MSTQTPPRNDKTIADLRETLFATMYALRDGTMPIETARQINETARTLVETAKVEVDYLRVTEGDKAPFLQTPEPAPLLPPGITRSVVHRAE